MSTASLETWFPFRQPRPAARVRVVCLPFAGGASLTYRPWVAALPATIEVCPLELPGHGTRMGEPLLATMPEIVRQVTEVVTRLADRPLAIFGHSMGARIGFELARALPTPPVHLFASAAPAPHLPRRRKLAHLTDRELIADMARLKAAPPAVLADGELMSLLLPILRNDLRLVEAYTSPVVPPLPLPITVLTGRDDEDVALAEAEAWATCTMSPATAAPIVVAGGHFFLDGHAAQIRAEIVGRLSAVVA